MSDIQIRTAPRRGHRLGRSLAALVFALLGSWPLLSGAPALAQTTNTGVSSVDLIEPANRFFNSLNSYLVTKLLEPTGRAYIDYTKPETRRAVANAFVNLREPITVLSDILLLDTPGAANATARFSINSTIGVFGFYDVATDYGYQLKPRRLTQVLCKAYLPEGPYFVLPFFGPANLRDTAAILATNYLQYSVAGYAYIPYRLLEGISIYTSAPTQPDTQVFDYDATRERYIAATRAACEAERQAN